MAIHDEMLRAVTVLEGLEWKNVGSVEQECTWCAGLAVRGGHDDDCELIGSLVELRERTKTNLLRRTKRAVQHRQVRRSARECQGVPPRQDGEPGLIVCKASGRDARVRWCNRRLQYLCGVCYAVREWDVQG